MNPNSVIITSSLPLKKRRIEILDSKPYQHPKTITSSPLPQGYQSVETRDKILKRLLQYQRLNAGTLNSEEQMQKTLNDFQRAYAAIDPLQQDLAKKNAPTAEYVANQLAKGVDKEQIKGELLNKIEQLSADLNTQNKRFAMINELNPSDPRKIVIYNAFDPRKTKDWSLFKTRREQLKILRPMMEDYQATQNALYHTKGLLTSLTGQEYDEVPAYLDNPLIGDVESKAQQKLKNITSESNPIQDEDMKRYLDNYRTLRNQFLEEPTKEKRAELEKAQAALQLAHFAYNQAHKKPYSLPTTYASPDFYPVKIDTYRPPYIRRAIVTGIAETINRLEAPYIESVSRAMAFHPDEPVPFMHYWQI